MNTTPLSPWTTLSSPMAVANNVVNEVLIDGLAGEHHLPSLCATPPLPRTPLDLHLWSLARSLAHSLARSLTHSLATSCLPADPAKERLGLRKDLAGVVTIVLDHECRNLTERDKTGFPQSRDALIGNAQVVEFDACDEEGQSYGLRQASDVQVYELDALAP